MACHRLCPRFHCYDSEEGGVTKEHFKFLFYCVINQVAPVLPNEVHIIVMKAYLDIEMNS